LLQDDLDTGRRPVLQLCGYSSVGRARPRHGRGHEFETRYPLHFGCAHVLRRRNMVFDGAGCARLLAKSRAARHHIRRDARAWTQPKWNHLHMSRSSSRPRTPLFQGGDAGSTPARDTRTGTLVEPTLREWKSAATIGRRRNPSPETTWDWNVAPGCPSPVGLSAAQPRQLLDQAHARDAQPQRGGCARAGGRPRMHQRRHAGDAQHHPRRAVRPLQRDRARGASGRGQPGVLNCRP
jgi:hypothetical protein